MLVLPQSPSMHCLWRAPTDNDRGGIEVIVSMILGQRLAAVTYFSGLASNPLVRRVIGLVSRLRP